jgi:hypothetical protein
MRVTLCRAVSVLSATLLVGGCTMPEGASGEKGLRPSWMVPEEEPVGGWTGSVPRSRFGWVAPGMEEINPVRPCQSDVILGGHFAMGGWYGATSLGIEVYCQHPGGTLSPCTSVKWTVPDIYKDTPGYTVSIPIDPITGAFRPPANNPSAAVTYEVHVMRGDHVRFNVTASSGYDEPMPFGIVTGFVAPACEP